MDDDRLTRAAVLSANGAYDRALAEAFDELVVFHDGEVSYHGTLERNAPSYAREIRGALEQDVEAVLLSATPRAAALVVNELGVLSRKRPQLYLSPLLKTELLIQNVSPEVLEGAIGVTPRIYDVSDDFPQAFAERWIGDQPLEGAYFYYDALALTAFALERALQDDDKLGAARSGEAILDVAAGPGEAARWNELPLYLPRLREGDVVYYTGLTGPMLLEKCGERGVGESTDWQVRSGAIVTLED
jgi:ABC-type branched-subunit amino acid transport system substrate-binding protein